MFGKKMASLACAGLLAAAACSDSTGFVGDQLSAAESAELASEYAAIALAGISSDIDNIPQSSVSAAPAANPISWERSGSFTRECDLGGSVTVSGTSSGQLDETRSGTITVSKTVFVDGCVRARGDVTITVNTPEPGIVFQGTVVVETRQRVSGEFTKKGVITYEASNGRSGECEIDLTISWNREGVHVVRGTFCGHDVNRSSGA